MYFELGLRTQTFVLMVTHFNYYKLRTNYFAYGKSDNLK